MYVVKAGQDRLIEEMSDEVVVSVICLTYNHEEYIRRCLEGFVSQETNFRFEVIVHDDASTDRTASIVKEYENKYPDLIKGIYQTENQYSKGVPIARTFVYPIAKGKYFALCEGDDYWCDSRKLQMQYDFLESHPDYTACFHSVLCNFVGESQENYLSPNISQSREFTKEDAIRGGAGMFRTSSTFVLRKILTEKPECFRAKGFGDLQTVIFAALSGRVYCFKEVMSVYNIGVKGSWTIRVNNVPSQRIEHYKEKIRMLNAVNQYYGYKYRKIFDKKIRKDELNVILLTRDRKRLLQFPYFFIFIKARVRAIIKHLLRDLFRLWKKIKPF